MTKSFFPLKSTQSQLPIIYNPILINFKISMKNQKKKSTKTIQYKSPLFLNKAAGPDIPNIQILSSPNVKYWEIYFEKRFTWLHYIKNMKTNLSNHLCVLKIFLNPTSKLYIPNVHYKLLLILTNTDCDKTT